MSRFESPRATSRNTSTSRRVRPAARAADPSRLRSTSKAVRASRGVELYERLLGRACLLERAACEALSSERTREQQPCTCTLVRHLASTVELDSILEERACRGIIPVCGCNDPLRQGGRGSELRRPDLCGKRSELRRRLSRPFDAPGNRGRPSDDAQSRDVSESLFPRDAAKNPLGERDRPGCVPCIKGELGDSHAGDWMVLDPSEERTRLVQPPLSPPQLTELCDTRCEPAAVTEILESSLELCLRLRPRPAMHQDRGVLRAAHIEERAELPPARERLHLVAPLHRPVEVARVLTGRDQVAAHLSDPHEVVHFTGSRGRRRLVEAADSFRDRSRSHERDTLERPADDLDVLEAQFLTQRDPAACGLERAVELALVRSRLRFPNGQPRVFGAEWLVFEEPGSPV